MCDLYLQKYGGKYLIFNNLLNDFQSKLMTNRDLY